MSQTVNQAVRLSFPQKISRLGERLHEAQWRRYGMVMLAGKVLGVAAVMLVATFITELCFTNVLAADSPVKA
ncbi:MAG: ammonium transporter, partial [Edaphobacter sp.]